MNALNATLKKAITNNNEILMNNTIELMKTLTTNQENNAKKMSNTNLNNETAYVKTPKWIDAK